MKKMIHIVLVTLLLTLIVACHQVTTTRTSLNLSTTGSSNPVSSTSTMTATTSSDSGGSSTVSETRLIDHCEVMTENPTTGKLVEIGLFEKEGMETIRETYNPYDYEAIRISVIFHSPSGLEKTIEAFWYKEYRDLTLIEGSYDEFGYLTSGQEMVRWLDDGISHYMVRIRPDEPGNWSFTYTVIVGGATVQSDNGTLTVSESETVSKGYIGVDTVNNRNFIFADNSSYFPLGTNLAWWSTSLGTYDYYNWFKHISDNGGNYARIWLSNRSLSLHKDSYSDFDTRQNIAIRLDRLFMFAEEFDIYVMLTLLNHGQFSENVNPEWGSNPYNSVNGGMIDLPIKFFYDDEAMAAYKNELRYIISRYGHSEHIFAWELFNEVDWVDGYNSGVVTMWHSEMATFIKEHDPYGHLVTTSYKYTYGTDAYVLDSLDFCAVHSYEYYDRNFYLKLLGEMDTLYNRYDKPVFFGEIGVDWENGNNTYYKDPTGITIHQGAWGGIMGGGAGGTMHWWWDSWIAKYNLWYRLEGIGAYIKYMDLGNLDYDQLRISPGVELSDTNCGIMGYFTNDTVYGYVYHKQWTYYNTDPSALENVSLLIPIDNGTYILTWHDTVTGAINSSGYVNVTSGVLEIAIPVLATDLAFTVKVN